MESESGNSFLVDKLHIIYVSGWVGESAPPRKGYDVHPGLVSWGCGCDVKQSESWLVPGYS